MSNILPYLGYVHTNLITNLVLNPVDFLSMQNHFISFWLSVMTITIGILGIWGYGHIRTQSEKVAKGTAQKHLKKLEEKLESIIVDLENKVRDLDRHLDNLPKSKQEQE